MKNSFEQELNELATQLNQMINAYDYVLADIFPKPFMLKYTNSTSIENFLVNSPLKIDFSEDLKSLSDSKLNQYVSDNTPFSTWSDMYTKAVKAFLAKKLDL